MRDWLKNWIWMLGIVVVCGSVIPISVVDAAQTGTATGAVELHWRQCEQVPVNGDWYGECHDGPAGGREAEREVAMIESDTNERHTAVLAVSGNAVFALPPGTYYIEGVPGDFVEEAFSFCSPADDLGTDLGHPVTIAAGDRVVCDYYYVPYDARAQGGDGSTPAPTAETVTETPPPATEAASDENAGYSTRISAGTCNAIGDNEPVAELSAPEIPSGDVVGAAGAPPVALSSSTISLSLNDLLAEDYVLVVSDGETDTPIACGALGGIRDNSGALAVGLQDLDASGVTGVAYLAAGEVPETSTNVSVFLLASMPEDAATPAAD